LIATKNYGPKINCVPAGEPFIFSKTFGPLMVINVVKSRNKPADLC